MAASTPNPSPDGTAGEPAGANPERPGLRGWVRELSKGAKWLLGTMVAALVGAVVAGAVAGWFAPTELGAELSKVSVDRNVTLNEFAIRHESDFASGPHREMVAALTPYVVVQTAPGDATTPDGDATPDDGTATDGGGTTTEDGTTTDGGTTTEDGTTTEGGTTAESDGLVSGGQVSEQDRESLQTGVDQAVKDAPIDLDIGKLCRVDPSHPKCGLRSVTLVYVLHEEDGPVSADEIRARVAEVFADTRNRPSPSDPARRQLVGVTVNFNISMTGFDDGHTEVRWSLYSAGAGSIVPRAWLRSQLALSLRGTADEDRGSFDFWVPLPEKPGPYFIRLGVYGGDTRLDYANTGPFG